MYAYEERRMITDLLFFLMTGATLMLLAWSGIELFQSQEDPLGDRLEELQSQAMAAAARPSRRSSGGANRILYLVSLFPGGEDWIAGSERLLNRAGFRRKTAVSLYIVLTLIWAGSLLGGMLWLQRGNPITSMLGGIVAALLLGFMIPNVVLERLVKR